MVPIRSLLTTAGVLMLLASGCGRPSADAPAGPVSSEFPVAGEDALDLAIHAAVDRGFQVQYVDVPSLKASLRHEYLGVFGGPTFPVSVERLGAASSRVKIASQEWEPRILRTMHFILTMRAKRAEALAAPR